MEINDLIQRFGDTPENQSKAIFSTIFIAGNQLQTLFDKKYSRNNTKTIYVTDHVKAIGHPTHPDSVR